MDKSDITVTHIRSVVLYTGQEDGAHSVYSPSLLCNELIFKLSGESVVCFDGKTAHETENCIRFLPAGVRSAESEYTVDIIKAGNCIDIYFITDYPISDEMLVKKLSGNIEIRKLFVQMQSLWYAKHHGYYHKCMALLYTILAEFIDQTNPREYLTSEKYDLIKPGIDYIEENFRSKSISCHALADICSISYSYFKKLFLMKFGVSPIKYIAEKRVSFACDLLNSNLYSISEISSLAGYDNVYYFSRAFKQATGKSPSEYRSNVATSGQKPL